MMKLQQLLEDHNTVHSAHKAGWDAADRFVALAGVEQPTNPYKEGTDEYNAWREGFKHGLNSTPWADGD